MTSLMMKEEERDITRTLISTEYIYSHLSSIFPDSVFLNLNFKILGISLNIQRSLGYSQDEVSGKSISCLEKEGTLEDTMRHHLTSGHFTDLKVSLSKKTGETLRYSISGFYLGLISDFSGIIVLKFYNRHEISILDQQIQLAKAQLDHFIYRASHDLRGPLATIQGLTNLLKVRTDNSEVDHFVQLINTHSQKLDERLSQLVYLAHVDEEHIEPSYVLCIYELETHIRKVIEQNAFIDFLEVHFSTVSECIKGVNEILINTLVTNLILYLLSLDKSIENNQVIIGCEMASSILTIRIKATGFHADPTIKKGINEGGALMYSDLIKYAKLTHIFAAQKVAWKLKSTILIDFPSEDVHHFTITIPKMSYDSQMELYKSN